ncbi:uncharacterized mitochondrial protein AtMg00860-like [Typha latifolia]|uniref:uncharacterized mitochondrial protein AtMg00860-like n=1 Tax=Typha latifolia TaxID=4733 RepID=UPI003C2EF2E2
MDRPRYTTPHELRGFLGLTGYYRCFTADYRKIVSPLTALLKKGGFQLSKKTMDAFEPLKATMISALTLALLDFGKPFIVECDAFGAGIGAILMRDRRPVAYLNKALSEW